MENREKWMRVRIRLIGFCFILAFGFIVARAFQLQVLGQDLWRQKAVRQHQKTIALTPQRGTIFDRNGEEMAVSVEVDSVYIEPAKVEADRQTAKALAEALSMPSVSGSRTAPAMNPPTPSSASGSASSMASPTGTFS